MTHKIDPGAKDNAAPIRLEEDASPTPRPAPRRPASPPPAAPPTRAKAAHEPRCPSCGYSLLGLALPQCPECGKAVKIPSALSMARRESFQRSLRAEYIRSGVWVAAAWIVMAILLAVNGNAAAIPWYYVSSVFMVAMGLGAFVLCSLIWIGFDQPLGVSALRLAAIYAIVDAASIGFTMIPGVGGASLLGLLLCLGIYISLLMRWLELEGRDAIAVAFVTVFVRFIVWSVLYAALFA